MNLSFHFSKLPLRSILIALKAGTSFNSFRTKFGVKLAKYLAMKCSRELLCGTSQSFIENLEKLSHMHRYFEKPKRPVLPNLVFNKNVTG